MIKAVIFDMDGLLIDSEPLWRKAEMLVFSKINIFLSEDDCRSTTGMRIDEVVKHWANVYINTPFDIKNIIGEINETMQFLIKTEGKAMPGVYNIIEFFKRKNIPMAIASSSSIKLINQVAKQLNIANDLAFVNSAYELDFGKPHPQVFIDTAKRLNISPNECLVFEDSVYGVIAARAAMMKVVAVPDELQFTHNDFCIAHHKISSLALFDEQLFSTL